MALSPLTGKPKWADPDVAWQDAEPPALADMMRSEADVDRFHNHEDQSPEAMAKAIDDLKATVGVLGGRLAAVEEGAAGVVHAAKDLGAGMVKMGDALSKRVKELEEGAARSAEDAARAAADAAAARTALAAERRARQKMVRFAIAGAAMMVAAMIGLTIAAPSLFPAHPASPAPVLYSPNAPAN